PEQAAQEEVYPQDLEGKKALLKTKRTEVRELAKLIEQLEGEIESLDPNAKKKRKLVTTQAAERTDFKSFTEVQGSVIAEDLVSISSETGGRIVQLNIKEGQSVRKGQLVAKLDLEQVDKQIAELQVQLELATEVYERQKRLWEQEIGSEIQLLQAENNKKRLEKGIESAVVQQKKANIYAPISGVVEMLINKTGEVAAPGAPIAMILNTSKVKVKADVPESLIQAVAKGQTVTVRIPALDWEEQRKITQIDNQIEPTNRTLGVEVNIPSAGGKIKPNLLASMLIQDNEQKDVITVPLELVQQEVGGKNFILVKDEGKEGAFAAKKYVKTGDNYNNRVVITKGLTGNEPLIIDGARAVRAGELIEVQ
ncbi:MAG: efflux RND transporter periplasmic adaptor subunit, partial [Bacteroidota bacterium]